MLISWNHLSQGGINLKQRELRHSAYLVATTKAAQESVRAVYDALLSHSSLAAQC